MTTNTNAAQVANNLIAVAEGQAFEAWYKQDCLVGGVNARIAARAAWNARAALTTAAAAVPPADWWRKRADEIELRVAQSGCTEAMRTFTDMRTLLQAAAAPKEEPVPAGEREELREGASYESMNLAAMVLSDCGHSSNYQPLLERVAGRIDRHVERLLTVQQADRALRAQAAPAAVAGPSEILEKINSLISSINEAHRSQNSGWRQGCFDAADNTYKQIKDMLYAAPTTQAAPQPAVQQGGDGGTDIGQLGRRTVLDAIRSAYDIGYSDARNARTYPGDSAPGYKGRDVEKDHGGALIAKLNALAARPHPAAPVAQVDAEDAARLDWLLLSISGAEFRRIGVCYSGNASRADVDAARAAKEGA